MNQHSSIKPGGSLLERAADKFDFAAALRGAARNGSDAAPEAAPVPAPAEIIPMRAQPVGPAPAGRHAEVDRARLVAEGFALPDMRPGPLAEEFRVVKRQLLLRAAGQGAARIVNGRMILVGSAKPDDGKTFCAINLALSMARETDLDVVLADCDFSKPELPRKFGVEDGPGLMDAIADDSCDIEACLIHTDIPNLSILPAGRHSDDATEHLAAKRTSAVFERLLARSPTRIVVCDTSPVLSASSASVLALHAGQTVFVVKADKTTEAELRESLNLLDGCDRIDLLLNAVNFAPNGQRFGDYYGYGD
ncbi:MAG: AAA family ATPase [Parasphingopyxis sp.]|nr:CpsD/CapB family tyrosine-protein kinase [Sphingomonadales bacterium]